MSETLDGRERVAKLIAARGMASRREAEQWIREGRVQVNGKVLSEPGTMVDPKVDHVRVDGAVLPAEPAKVYYLMYKPRGFLTTRRDEEDRPTVQHLLERLPHRVEPVGRLDFDSEGALLLTNDGELSHRLAHPSTQVPRRYVAKVWRTPDEHTLERLRNGIRLEDGRTPPCKVRLAKGTDQGNAWVEITITEGRNRLIRRMLAAVNHPVSKLRRESFATISIRGMERGDVRALTAEEVGRLREIAEGKPAPLAGHTSKRKSGHAKAKIKPTRRGRKPLDARRPRRYLSKA